MQTGIMYGLMIGEQPTELLPGDFLCFDLEHRTAVIIRGAISLKADWKSDSKTYLGFNLDRETCLSIASLVAYSHGYNIEAVTRNDSYALFEFCVANHE